MTIRTYVICATPRSGSTLLCDLLTDTGIAGRPASYFRREDLRDWAARLQVRGDPATPAFARNYLAAVLDYGRGGLQMCGLRLMWPSLGELCTWLDGIYPGVDDDAGLLSRAFGATRYVHLSREDKVAQAASLLKADQTGLWHAEADGSERERIAPPRAAVYDAERIAGYVAELQADDAAWGRWFAANRIEPVRITYERLSREPRVVVAELLSALGLDPKRAKGLAPRTSRLADSDSRNWIARFRAEVRGPTSRP